MNLLMILNHGNMLQTFHLTQFYKLAVDDAYPFYNIFGGTQDNNTQGGPSRTFKDIWYYKF